MIPLDKVILVQDLLIVKCTVRAGGQRRLHLRTRQDQVFICTRPKWYMKDYFTAIKDPSIKIYWIINGNVVEPHRGETILKFSYN